MLGKLLRRLGGGSETAAAPAASSRVQDELETLLPAVHAFLREGRVAEALVEVAPALAAGSGTSAIRDLNEFALGVVAELTRQDARRAEITYHLGTILLSLDDEEGAALCAGIAWNEAGAVNGYRRFERGPDIVDYCRAAGLPVHEFPHLAVARMDERPAPRVEHSHTSMCLLRDALVIGESFLPAAPDGIVFTERCVLSPLKLSLYSRVRQIDMLRMVGDSGLWSAASPTDRYAGPHVLVGNHENIGHWLISFFSRLRLLEEMPGLRDATIVVGEDARPLHLECLRRAGFDDSRVLRLPRGRYAAFDELWVPSFLCGISSQDVLYWNPAALEFVRRRLGAAPPAGGTRRIYLSRRGVRWRKLQNEDEVAQALARLGFEEVDPGTLGLAQQIELAAQAAAIVGVFGAGMNFHLFAAEGVPVIQLQPQERMRMDIHAPLTRALRQPFGRVAGRIAGNHPDPLKSDFAVPVDKLVEVVSKLLDSSN